MRGLEHSLSKLATFLLLGGLLERLLLLLACLGLGILMRAHQSAKALHYLFSTRNLSHLFERLMPNGALLFGIDEIHLQQFFHLLDVLLALFGHQRLDRGGSHEDFL